MNHAVSTAKIGGRSTSPASLRFKSLWVASINSKLQLTRSLGDQRLIYENSSLSVTKIVAIVKPQPLRVNSSNTADLEPVKPGHFPVRPPPPTPPERSHLASNPHHLCRWNLIIRMRPDSWNRWRIDYLHTPSRHRYRHSSCKLIVSLDNLLPR